MRIDGSESVPANCVNSGREIPPLHRSGTRTAPETASRDFGRDDAAALGAAAKEAGGCFASAGTRTVPETASRDFGRDDTAALGAAAKAVGGSARGEIPAQDATMWGFANRRSRRKRNPRAGVPHPIGAPRPARGGQQKREWQSPPLERRPRKELPARLSIPGRRRKSERKRSVSCIK